MIQQLYPKKVTFLVIICLNAKFQLTAGLNDETQTLRVLTFVELWSVVEKCSQL